MGGQLLSQIVRFGRLLRDLGLDVNSGQIIDFVQALEHVGLKRRDDFRDVARCIFVHRREEIPLFDAAFDTFWQPPATLTPAPVELKTPIRPPRQRDLLRRLPPKVRAEMRRPPTAQRTRREERIEIERILTYSAVEVLRKKDFESFTWEEIQQAKRLMSAMEWRVGERFTRRRQNAPKGQHLDLRRTLRRNLKHGGEIIRLAWRTRKTHPRPIVILCDISGSMERYSRMLLHFLHTITNGMDDVESFVFSTRLTRITRHLAQRDVDDAIDEVSRAVLDWSGGTRIGEALKTFNYEWARRVLGRGAVVLVISDGWDRGDISLLSKEMERLQKSCYRLIWLNPLLGSPEYEPLTQGIQAALPFVDDFLPVHNLESLEALGQKLGEIAQRRPARRQRVVIKAVSSQPSAVSYQH